MFAERYTKRLTAQRQSGLYRNPPEIERREGKYLCLGNSKLLNFASNDYLGLGVSSDLRQIVARNFQKYGTSSSSSRLVSGNYSLIRQAEEAYASFFGYEDALFYPSGYQANVGVLATLFEAGDTLVFDKHIHASSVKGMVLSGADFRGYNHNSMKHLCKRIDQIATGQAAVLTESLFSMDGDRLDVEGFEKARKQYGFLSIVDEAHAFGAIGEGGAGIARTAADIAVGTFGKALGFFGAFVLLPRAVKEYLFNFSSPLIYSTTLPEAHAASAIEILSLVAQSDERRRCLHEISAFMKESLRREGFGVTGDAHIIALKIGDEQATVQVAQSMQHKGFFVPPVRYPTVPLGQAILRLSMTALHTTEDVTAFVKELCRSAIGVKK